MELTQSYLKGYASKWWRTTRQEEGKTHGYTWEFFKGCITLEFIPKNSDYISRCKLYDLMNATNDNLCQYVKAYSELMLEIRHMHELDRVCHFVMGLPTWAKRKLEENWPASLSKTIMKVEDFSDVGRGEKNPGSRRRTNSLTRRHAMKGIGTEGKAPRKRKSLNNFKARVSNLKEISSRKKLFLKRAHLRGDASGKPKGVCFNYNEMGHYYKDCPAPKLRNRGSKVIALAANLAQNECNRLIFLKGKVYKRNVLCFLNTRASHNFITRESTKRMELQLEELKAPIKVHFVDGVPHPTTFQARNVPLQLGNWRGNVDLSISTLGGMDCILGMEFITHNNVFIERHNRLIRIPSKNGVVQVNAHEMSNVGGSTIHLMLRKNFGKGMHGRLWHACVMRVLDEFEPKETADLVSSPKCLKQILNEFPDVMPEELPAKK
jgi:hypothetical protein